MNEARFREIIREELASFFAEVKAKPAADVISIKRSVELRQMAQNAMSEKLRGKA